VAAAGEKALDLRRAVPADVYMVVHAKHNPERDFQREYHKAIWKTVEETKIIERAVGIVTSRLSRDDVDKAKAVLDEVRNAAAPIKLEALANAKEVIYAQEMRAFSDQMKVVTSQHLVLARLTPEAAADTQKGIKNLFGLVEKYSEGKVPVESSTEGDATIVTLAVPQQVPFQPTVIRIGDVLLLSSSEEMARKSLGMLLRGDGKSKFDDPRLKEALSHLPAPEDALVFYDAKTQFSQMRGMVDFLHTVGQNDPKAERVAGLLELFFDEIAFLDYQITVEYTEGNLNRSVEYGKLVPDAEKKVFAKVLGSGKPFDDWRSWVPANAVAYSLSAGVNLHPLYERIIGVIKERFPEAEKGLEKFEEIQSKIGVHLDRDILQAFSGEHVSISLPAAKPSLTGGRGSVVAMRCQKPDRIRELLHRLVDKLKEHPAVAAQQLQLAKCEDLEGFEQLSALALTGFGVKPMIGFRDGWMMIGSNADAINAVLATKAGKAPSIADAASFKQFHLNVDGPVQSIGYKNSAEDIHQVAAALNQAGVIVPMVIGMVGAKANPEDLKPVQEVLGLLPSLGKIVSKFDFLQAKLSVTQAGRQPGTYECRSVTVVRPPAGAKKEGDR
jgi:hypothetical protein